MNYFKVKRGIDCVVSSIALIILSPVMLITAICIKLDSPGPVFFIQERIGLHGKPYKMYKFRSMCVGAQNMGTGLYCLENDSRVTKVGKVIRRTSIDELPQLINIIKGDMAIVGPRSPVVGGFPEWKDLSKKYKRRFSVLPGLTGLAQVTGRNELSWDEKVKFDNIYISKVKKYGIFYDFMIILLTVKRVFTMHDVAETVENMEKNKEALKL